MRFEKVSRFNYTDINLPQRKTKDSAGYDFEVAEDIVIPPYHKLWDNIVDAALNSDSYNGDNPIDLDTIAQYTKASKAKPTLVSTGVKAYIDDNKYLELSVRSSCPLKHWLILANGVGIIDSDYVDNPDNEGEIFFQMINLSPFPIALKKGDRIGQGIIKDYYLVEGDSASRSRVGGFGSTND